MVEPRFTSWTRRRFGLAMGSLTISLAGLADARPIDARNKKKRCKTLRQSCNPAGRRCCDGRTCGGDPALGRFCCKQGGEPCRGNGDCCNVQCVQGLCALN